MDKLSVGDLFCGMGGFSLGFQTEPFDVLWGLDHNPDVQTTFELNHANTKFHLKDIFSVNPHDLEPVDILIGSPPCQSFSKANNNREYDMALVNVFRQWIDVLKPKYWIMENVPSLITLLNPSQYPVIRLLNAVYYGTPQIRQRTFAGSYPYPMITHTPKRKGLLQSPQWNNVGSVINPNSNLPNEYQNIYLFYLHNPYKNGVPDPTHYLRPDGDFIKKHPPLNLHLPSRVVTSKKDQLPIRMNDGHLRPLIPEELLLLQGFPKSFQLDFNISESAQFLMIGNAVSPCVSNALAQAILKREKNITT